MGFESARFDCRVAGVSVLFLPFRTGGRPDVMKLVKEAYYAWGAEVVFITSNYQGNKEIMEGCKEAGIPAFVGLLFFYLCVFLMPLSSGHALGFLSFAQWLSRAARALAAATTRN